MSKPILSFAEGGRLNITLDEGHVAPTVLSLSKGRVAENRSGFLAEAAREHLARQRERLLKGAA